MNIEHYFISLCLNPIKSSVELQVKVRNWIKNTRKLNMGLVNKRGTGKGTIYYINPKLIANSKANVKTTLKNIEPYTLKALIIEDLKVHPKSLMSEIAERLPDVEIKELRNMVYKMVGEELNATGGRTYRRYELVNGRKEKK